MSENNLYARQKLADSPAHFAKLQPVTLAEIKAFIAINLIMGMVRLPRLNSY